jgi:hypothetical protein
MSARLDLPGTEEERLALVAAISMWCECATAMNAEGHPVLVEQCATHRHLVSDAHAVQRLIYARRLAVRLLEEEFCQ